MKRLLLFCFALSAFNGFAQHGICDSAMVVDKEICGPAFASGKPNARLALKDSTGIYFEKPHSVVWFTFVAPEDTMLTFDLVPSVTGDDIDFLLFKDSRGDFCRTLNSNKVRPIRSNISRCDKLLECKTGLSITAEHSYEALGNHPAYSSAVAIKKGERYYIAADNYTSASRPFTLYLHLRWNILQAPKPLIAKPSANITLNIFVMDSLNNLVKARLKIVGVTKKEIDTANVSNYNMLMQHGQRIKISSIATGYLLNQVYKRAPAMGDTFSINMVMRPIKEHQNMVLEDIEFEPEQPVFLPTASEPLSNLLEFMQSNNQVSIVVKGYVNDPQGRNPSKSDQNLSEDRAKTVVKYLSDHGIDQKRMEWIGFGNRDMLYPNPQTQEEQQANRRVEVEIK